MSQSTELKMAKNIARHRVRDALKAMTASERTVSSRAACERIARLPPFSAASTIMLYLPMPGEADCTRLIEAALQSGRRVCVPAANWHDHSMEAALLTSLDPACLREDAHGVRSPRDVFLIEPEEIDLVIVPGLAFDEHRRRLGRGGGFYDRFLARLSARTVKVGLAFERQVLPEVPSGPHDVVVNMVATERRVVGIDA